MKKALRATAVLLVATLVAVLAVFGSGCAEEQEPVTPPEPVEPSAEEPSAAEETVAGACTSCHDMRRIYLAQDYPDWNDVISRMVETHDAQLTAQEQADVIAYLNSLENR